MYRLPRTAARLISVSLISVLAGNPTADGGDMPDVLLASDAVRQQIQDRDYGAAIDAIDQALAAEPASADHLMYLKGRALYGQRQYDAAVAVLQQMVEQFPESPWRRKASFAAGVALARAGDFQAAERIYRSEAESLLDTDRKHELAAVLLQFADDYYHRNDEDDQPDYNQAVAYYEQSLEIGLRPDKRVEVQLRVARCRQQMDQLGEAAILYEQFIEEHSGDPLVVEARFRLGECRLGEGDSKRARRAWQDLLAAHQDSDSDFVARASFQLSRTWDLPEPNSDGQLELGVASLKDFLKRFPTHELAGRAHLDIARSYLHCGRQEDAVRRLEQLLGEEQYRECEEVAEAQSLLGQAYYEQEEFAKALTAWQGYLVRYPTDPAWSNVQQQVIDTEYLMGLDHFEAEDYDAARQTLGQFMGKYPLDRRVPGILVLYGRMHYQQQRHDDAIADWRRVVSKYPKTDEASYARYMIGVVLEEEMGKPKLAMEEYRKVTWGEYASQAQAAAARLTEKTMSVMTERVFRSSDIPRVKLSTRNIQSVQVRVYRVDMESYFRKVHATDGVEKLDIALIDPADTFDFQISDYAEHLELERFIDVPLPGGAKCGAMAVTVASETHEATSLVIQSDLDIIVKATQSDVFVFAENMRSGKPWPGVQLLVSDGNRIVAEGVTGNDGAWRPADGELAELGEAKVLAVSGGHVASNLTDLRPLDAEQGLSDKGYLFTDRPAYRAGQHVYIRGCIRQVKDDAYAIEMDKKYTLLVNDPRDRVIHHKEVALGDFGSFFADFRLPPSAAAGEYRIQIDDGLKQQYQGTFRVQEYRLEPVRLIIDVPRRVYYRGEEIHGSIRAEYDYGAPLPGRAVVYQLSDDRRHTATTDADGRVHFALPTSDFAESQTLTLAVSLPEQNLDTTADFYLATQGFSIDVSTIRDVFLAGETIEPTVATADAEGKPVGRKLTLVVMELTSVDGTVGERFVQQQPFETAADDGIGRPALKLDRGGRYRLRVEGADRFGHTVSSQRVVEVSDERDQSRLRLFADEHWYRAGDTAEVTLHWREKPALALVTFEGASLLDYKLVSLKTGANQLSVPMEARLAPNFQLAAAVMTDPKPTVDADTQRADGTAEHQPSVRLHEAVQTFFVERRLDVSVTYRPEDATRTAVRPGDRLNVTVRTTDPQGSPVPAEVSLALIDQALAERFSWPTPPIQDFFQGVIRKFSISTYSSIDFSYRPETSPIHPRLLSERQREELAQQERASLQRGFPQFAAGMGGMGFGMGGAFAGEPGTAEGAFGESGNGFLELVASFEDPRAQPPSVTTVVPVVTDANELGPADRPTSDDGDGPPSPSAAGDDFAHATGYWNSSIVTDEDGTATVTLTVPDRVAAWTFSARGITTDTLAGETEVDLVPKAKDLFGQLRLPEAFIEGDQAQVTAVVHNSLPDEGTVHVSLATEIAGRRVEQRETLSVSGNGVHEVPFDVSLALPEHAQVEGDHAASSMSAVFELTVVAGDQKDTTERIVPLLPYGMTVYATTGGVADSATVAWIEASDKMPVQDPWLQILVGPTVEQSLLEVFSAPKSACNASGWTAGTDVEQACSDLMAGLGLQKLAKVVPQYGEPRVRRIDDVIRTSIGHLVSAQNDDGGWAWAEARGESDRFTSARVLWALALARRGGYAVADENYDPLLRYVEDQIAATENRDFEGKAVLLHALAVAGKDHFSLANRLYRERTALGPSALVCLALAFAEMDRGPVAAELMTMVRLEDFDGDPSNRFPTAGLPARSNSPVELRALHALALQATTPEAAATKNAAEWLVAHRTGHRWSPDKATGPAMLALCQWYSESERIGEKYRLIITVNDRPAATLDVDAEMTTRIVDVPADRLINGRQKIGFRLEGRGRYTYQIILGGHVPAEQLKSTTAAWSLRRTYEPAPLEVDGRPISRGFDVVRGKTERFRNQLNQLPVGRRGWVELRYWRNLAQNPLATPQYYLVITEPIPNGAAVIEHSITGAFDRYEIGSGSITFYARTALQPGIIHYELRGYLPGDYRAAPTVARNAYRPDQMAVSTPKSLTVLPAGTESADQYRLTPMELLQLGTLAREKGDLEAASSHLTELINGWSLASDTYKHVVQLLLDIQLELDQPDKIVRYFEIILERWPQERIAFDDGLKIGVAYHRLGEFERSYLGFRAIVESNFRLESGVAGFLAARDEFLPSVDALERLLREYPPEPYVTAAQVALAQQVLAKAPEAANDQKLRDAEVNRVEVILHAWRLLEGFLSAHADDPAADQAAFSAANALLELGKYAEAADACERYARRYPDSKLLNSFWYIIGFCRFADGAHEPAGQALQRVVEASTANSANGDAADRSNKWPAIYILGQIHHSLSQPAEAISYYRQVEDRFPDAKKSIAYFLRKAIRLPDVTVVRPGKPVSLELEFRNIASCDARVYRIDLMKFALLHQDLSRIAQINLAGIEPHHTTTAELGDGKDYQDRSHKLPLELEKEGAYLVVCRGENEYASGLVLITPLDLEVQYDEIAEEVRATVKDVVDDRYVNAAEVKVTGSMSADFVSGTTDRRGLFVADGIAGTPTVIAHAGAGRYALYRGKSKAMGLPSALARQLRGADTSSIAAGVGGDDPFASGGISAGVTLSDAPAAERRIQRALDGPTAVAFVETPLEDAARFLSRQHGIPILIDARALEDVGIGTDIPVTFRVSGITLRSALRNILKEFDLTYTIRDECLLISTPEEAESELITTIYPVSDLVRFRDADDEQWADFDTLIDMITSTVAPVTWDTVGGPGAIEGMTYGNTDVIILSQTQDVHDQIEGLLGKLRTVAGDSPDDGQLPVRERPSWDNRFQRGFGFGGMGGMGGMFGGPVTGSDRPSNRANLLRSLQDAQRDLQRREIEKLREMYKQGQGMGGMGGVGAGGFF